MSLHRIATAILAVTALTGLSFAGISQVQAESSSAGSATDFYQLPAQLPSANGALIRQEASAYYLDPFKTTSADADVTRVMYKSTNSLGQPMAVTGTVLVPRSQWVGAGSRPLISLAAGTQGQGDQCAPSKQLAMGTEYEGALLAGLLLRGYAVAVTDYEGLGTNGTHTYLSRASQGHAVLDAARAALRLGVSGLNSNTRIGIVGYSQGGGAAASAAELAASYGSELKVMGTYAGAVPADLQSVASNIDGTLYSGLLLYAANGFLAERGIDPARYFNQVGLQTLQDASQECLFSTLASKAFMDTTTITRSGQTFSQMTQSGELKTILDEQKIGVNGAPQAPILIGQSLYDDVVPEPQARALAKRWCDAGVTVQYSTTSIPTHIGGYIGLLPELFSFLEGRVAGLQPPKNCGSF
ncbi:lipase family protein [Psychromicrobium sp. YIM B11713]|uniref:lipase family protein n=1 Tax=Psychromicrobium sp. YIM B11713 TaxID=3145233 RepID=UPI00374F4AC4